MANFNKQKYNHTRQEFLLTFFGPEPRYEEKLVNGFWLIKHLVNGGPQVEVDIFSPAAFEQYKLYRERQPMNLATEVIGDPAPHLT